MLLHFSHFQLPSGVFCSEIDKYIRNHEAYRRLKRKWLLLEHYMNLLEFLSFLEPCISKIHEQNK